MTFTLTIFLAFHNHFMMLVHMEVHLKEYFLMMIQFNFEVGGFEGDGKKEKKNPKLMKKNHSTLQLNCNSQRNQLKCLICFKIIKSCRTIFNLQRSICINKDNFMIS